MQNEILRNEILGKFSYEVETANYEGNFPQTHHLKAIISEHEFHPLTRKKGVVWEVKSIETEEDGHHVFHWEHWKKDFTLYCNDLMRQGVIVHWQWKNYPRVTWDNKPFAPDMSISSETYEKGIEVYASWSGALYYKEPD
jgi:hypothetical protein